MGRTRRAQYERGIVHAYTRGNARARIVFDEFDSTAWMRLLARTVETTRCECHSYVLMPNHYHLLLRGSRAQVSQAMRHLNGSFAQRINTRYDRTGHVFEGPFHEELIVEESHLLEAIRYVPLNPVRAGLCERPEDWPHSSYRAIAGLERRPPFLTVSFVRAQFGRGGDALRAYRAFVEAKVSERAMPRDLVPGHGP